MSIISDLFGGGDQTTTTSPWAPAQPYLAGPGGVLPEAKRLYETGGPKYFQGPTLAQPSAPTTEGRNLALNYARSALPSLTQGAMQTQQFLTNPNLLDPNANPYLAATAQAALKPITQQLTESILPSIGSGAVQAGQFGGGRQDVLNEVALRDWSQTAGDITSEIYSDAYQSGLDTLLAGLGVAPSTAALGAQPAALLSQVGAELTSEEQASINEAIKKWTYEQGMPFQNLDWYNNLVAGTASLGGETTAPSGGSPLTGAIQGGVSGLGVASSLLPEGASLGGWWATPWLAGGGALLGALGNRG